jgi:hypothetical protein
MPAPSTLPDSNLADFSNCIGEEYIMMLITRRPAMSKNDDAAIKKKSDLYQAAFWHALGRLNPPGAVFMPILLHDCPC